LATTPGPLALRAALLTYSGNDRRVALNSPQLFANNPAREKVERWLRNYVLDGTLEIGLVGDFATADAITSAAATIGTLKARSDMKPGRPLSVPVKAFRAEGSSELPASTSLSCVLWPVSGLDEPRKNAALAIATDILKDRATAILREKLGANYASDVRVFRDAVQRDFVFVGMINTFEPTRSRELNVLSLAIAATLAKNGISQEEFDRLKEPARTQRMQELHNNDWWISVTAVAQRRKEVLDEIRQHSTVIDQVTIDDVNQAAQVFKPDRFTSILLHPTSANIPPVKTTEKKKPSNKSP